MEKRSIHSIPISLVWVFLTIFTISCQKQQVGWPNITNETKPWARWWWMGNSVDPSDLTAAMEAYSEAGLGGLEITPIYGVHGYEDQFIKFLSAEWMDNFNHTLREGKRLNLGIDLAMASGWPFGGPWVTANDACKYMKIKTYNLKEGEQLQQSVFMEQEPLLRTVRPNNLMISQLQYPISANADSLQNWAIDQVRYPMAMPLKVLMAYSDKGEIINLTTNVTERGNLNWRATAGTWKLYAVFEGWHGKMVERAGPGGEGDVIDHFSSEAIDHYLGHFTETFKSYETNGLRAYFNDSYEVDDARGEADFTPLMFAEFQKRRGYDLRNYLPALIGDEREEICCRVLSDYRETISDLILENYTQRWHDWANRQGKIIRNQAHGAPANILDLYAAADIPETEGEDMVKIKTASSVAHVTGKKLASSESATWVKDHFIASLADVKQAVDLYLLAGINHVFYHGTTFSPQNAPWPGWMFYASVHFGTTNTFWNDFGVLNNYITRSQAFLQEGKPDNDILLYYPISDEYADRGRSFLRHFDGAAKGTSLRKSAEYLFDKGYAFDYISDRQILNLKCESGRIITGKTTYQTILLPPMKYIPVETFEKIITLAQDGATILMEQLPLDIPGMGRLDERRAKFQKLLGSLQFETITGNIQEAKVGKGFIHTGELQKLLELANVRREEMFDRGIQCIRRVDENTTTYFIANRGTDTIDDMVHLESNIVDAVLFDPMNGNFGKAIATKSEVYLQLNPRETCIVQLFKSKISVPDYSYFKSSGKNIVLNSAWELLFKSGGPTLPQSVRISELGSWTDIMGDDYKAFSGTAIYKTSFPKPTEKAEYYRIDLGKVFHSARVILNGRELATLICTPYTVDFPANILEENNRLEIAVTNLMGNRIAAMERKGEAYKIFYNINFPAHEAENRGADGLFTTLGWKPQESGLIGPVKITPLNLIE
jgi:hypothetical protein